MDLDSPLLGVGLQHPFLRGGSWNHGRMVLKLGAAKSAPLRLACDCQGSQGESIAFLRIGIFIKTQSHSLPSGVIHPSLSNSVASPPHACHFSCQFQWVRLCPHNPRGPETPKDNNEASSQSLFGLMMEPSDCKSIVSSLNPFLCWLRIRTWRAKLCCREQVSLQSSGSHCIC